MIRTILCKACEQKLVGRSDKKFCSDYCRNAYHGEKNRDQNNYMRNVNNILRRNRSILFELIELDKEIVEKEELRLRGFNFKFYTNSWQVNKTENYYFIYECGFVELSESKVKIMMAKQNKSSLFLFEARQ